jgi:hypothetical protein
LFNAAASRFGGPIPHIIPLDPILTSSVAKPDGATLGFRLSRRLKPRLSAELSFEKSGSLSIDSSALSTIEASRKSFASAFAAVTTASAQSTATTRNDSDFLSFMGAVTVNTRRVGRVVPFVSIGAGLLSRHGATPSATLAGSYDLGAGDVISDTVKIDFGRAQRNSFTTSIGGGFKVPLTMRLGIRFDVSAYLYRNPITTTLTTSHTDPRTIAFIVADAPEASPAFNPFISFVPTGTLVGSPGPPPGTVSSLSGTTLSGFRSFRENGLQNQIQVSIGTYWRF